MNSQAPCRRLTGHPRLFALLLALLLPLLLGTAHAQAPLVVDGRADLDPWPHLSVMPDPDGQWRVDELLPRLAQFNRFEGARGNLGLPKGTAWLTLPLDVPGAHPVVRVLALDYPLIWRVEGFVVQDGRVLQHQRSGLAYTGDERSLRSSGPSLRLDLPPGRSTLLLRIETRTAFVVPMSLRTPEAAGSRDAIVHALYGLHAGLLLCMLLYTLSHGLSLRDPVFLYYGGFLAGNMLSTLQYSGLGALYVWPGDVSFSSVAAQAGVLLSVSCAPFLRHILKVHEVSRICDAVLVLVSPAALVSLLALLAGLLDTSLSIKLSMGLGLLTFVATVPVALLRAWRGQPEAYYMLGGWLCYAVGGSVVSLLTAGKLDPSPLMMALYPLSMVAEMAAWLAMLGLRVRHIHGQAERSKAESAALHSLAHTDALTGLQNRRGLQQALAASLAAAQPKQLTALYLLDLDGFKPVNDRHGHDVGDALLVGVAQRLREAMRDVDIVARLGGDEFVVVANGLADERTARQVGQKLLASFEAPFVALGQHCQVGATIGYALAPLDATQGDELMRRADAAMYNGKKAGRRRVERSGVAAVAAPP